MNRRDFIKSATMAAGEVAVVATHLSALAASKPGEQAVVSFPFVRPQVTDDDLVAEYEAWVARDYDGFDTVVANIKQSLGISPEENLLAHGKCNCCSSEVGNQARLHLDREMAVARGRIAEQEARLRDLTVRRDLLDRRTGAVTG